MKILLLLGDFGAPTLSAFLKSRHRLATVVLAIGTPAPPSASPGTWIRDRLRPLVWPGIPGPPARDLRPWRLPAVLARAGIPRLDAWLTGPGDLHRLVTQHHVDAICSIGYPKILPPSVLEAPPLGTVNVHPSLLPRFRGPSPVFWQIALGEARGGITIHRMTAEVDGGPILLQAETLIGREETAGQLFVRLGRLAAAHLPGFLDRLAAGRIEARNQDATIASEQRRYREQDSLVDWSRPAEESARLIRACNPFPGAGTLLADGDRVRIWRAKALPGLASPRCGVVVAVRRTSFDVATGDAILRVYTATSDHGHRFPAWGRPWPALREGTMCTSALSVSNPPGETPFCAVEERPG